MSSTCYSKKHKDGRDLPPNGVTKPPSQGLKTLEEEDNEDEVVTGSIEICGMALEETDEDQYWDCAEQAAEQNPAVPGLVDHDNGSFEDTVAAPQFSLIRPRKKSLYLRSSVISYCSVRFP